MKALLFVLFAISAVLAQQYTMPPYTHHAQLDNVQAGTSSTSVGGAVISLSRSTTVLTYTLVHNVATPTAAHIHCAASVGVASGVLVTLSGYMNPTSSGTVTLNTMSGYSSQWLDWFDGALCYFNIHTSANPNGEIRGQILAQNQQVTGLTGAQDGVTTSAVGVGFAQYTASTMTLTGLLYNTVSGATAAHIHGPGYAGQTAGVVCTLNATSLGSFSCQFNAAQQEMLYSGQLYYNVHSTANPNGEIRGQIYPPVNLLAEMDGQQDGVTTTSAGIGMAAVYGSDLWAAMVHDITGDTVTAAHIHNGSLAVNGPPEYVFSNAATSNPIWQNFSVIAGLLPLMNDPSYYYFNIHTTAQPNGLIRGQIYPKMSSGGGSSTTATMTMTGQSTTATTAAAGTTTTAATAAAATTTTTAAATTTAGSSTSTSSASSVVVSALAFVAAVVMMA